MPICGPVIGVYYSVVLMMLMPKRNSSPGCCEDMVSDAAKATVQRDLQREIQIVDPADRSLNRRGRRQRASNISELDQKKRSERCPCRAEFAIQFAVELVS